MTCFKCGSEDVEKFPADNWAECQDCGAGGEPAEFPNTWEDACEAPEHEAPTFEGYDRLMQQYPAGCRQPPAGSVAHMIMMEATAG